MALLIAITGLASMRTDVFPSIKNTPASAVHSIDVAKAGTILNDYNFGGYLDFVGIPPSSTAGPSFTARPICCATIGR